jgi:hypothetical protein
LICMRLSSGGSGGLEEFTSIGQYSVLCQQQSYCRLQLIAVIEVTFDDRD